MLPASWQLELVDLNVEPLTDRAIHEADVVMISAMLVQEPSVREVIARCHAAGRRIVAGGPLFTTGAERFDDVDCCVVGECEGIIGQLVSDLDNGTLRRRYQASTRPDLSLTPVPRWDLIRMRDYAMMPVQFSRGCPFDCEFCDISAVYGRVPRVKSAPQLLAELDALRRANWRGGVFVVDDNFIGNRARAKDLLRAIVGWRKSRPDAPTLTTEASINLADDPELMDLMVKAGFKHVFIGIETPNEAALLECRKVQNTRRDLVATVRTIHQRGLEVMAGFIVGFDSDTKAVFDQQKRFIEDAGVVTAMVGLLTALPGTRLFTRLTCEGRMIARSTGNNLDGVLNFVTRLDRQVVSDGYRRLLKDLYAPKSYYSRIRRFMDDYRPTTSRSRVRAEDLRIVVRSLWTIGVASPARFAFWKLLARTSLRHRRQLPEAIELAIRGHHFRIMAARL